MRLKLYIFESIKAQKSKRATERNIVKQGFWDYKDCMGVTVGI
jgi:hypothetical protein